MSRYENNYCEVCGAPVGDGYEYCREHSRNFCGCGRLKYRDDEVCRHCRIESEKQVYGFGICPICGEEFKFPVSSCCNTDRKPDCCKPYHHYRHEHQKAGKINKIFPCVQRKYSRKQKRAQQQGKKTNFAVQTVITETE